MMPLPSSRASVVVRSLWAELCAASVRPAFWDDAWPHHRALGLDRATFDARGVRRRAATLAFGAGLLELAALWARDAVDLGAAAALEGLGDDPVYAELRRRWHLRRDEARHAATPQPLDGADLPADLAYKVDRTLAACTLLEPVAPIEVFAAFAVRSPSLVPLRRDASPRDDQLRRQLASLPYVPHGDLMLEALATHPLDAAALALAVPVAARLGSDRLVDLAQRLMAATPVGALRVEAAVGALVAADERMLARAVSRLPLHDPYDPVEIVDRAAAAAHLGTPLAPGYVEGLVAACRAGARLEAVRIACRATDDPAWAASVLVQALPLTDTSSTGTHLSVRHLAFVDSVAAPLAERAAGRRFGAEPL